MQHTVCYNRQWVHHAAYSVIAYGMQSLLFQHMFSFLTTTGFLPEIANIASEELIQCFLRLANKAGSTRKT